MRYNLSKYGKYLQVYLLSGPKKEHGATSNFMIYRDHLQLLE
jgi:hypothetical protein